MTHQAKATVGARLFHETPFTTPEARLAASRLANRKRQWMIDNLLHRYETFDAGWKLLERVHRPVLDGDVGRGTFGAIYGDTRVGKTSIIDAYRANHPSTVDEDGEIYPIVRITATAGMTPSTLSDEFYFQTGSRAQATKTSQFIRDRNAIDRLVMHRTELVIVDDVQFLLFNRRRDEMPKFNSFLRTLIDYKEFAVVFVGEPKVQEWVMSHPDISSRSYTEEHLDRYDRSEGGRDSFQLLMGAIDDLLPFAEPSDLGEPDMADEMWAYSDGYLGRAMSMLRYACWTSINEGHRRVKLQTLHETCKSSPWQDNRREYFRFGSFR